MVIQSIIRFAILGLNINKAIKLPIIIAGALEAVLIVIDKLFCKFETSILNLFKRLLEGKLISILQVIHLVHDQTMHFLSSLHILAPRVLQVFVNIQLLSIPKEKVTINPTIKYPFYIHHLLIHYPLKSP